MTQRLLTIERLIITATGLLHAANIYESKTLRNM